MSQGTSIGERALTVSVLILVAVVTGAATRIWLRKWREAVANP